MRFEVPQFIEIEDKIFGPLTWKQFVYVVGGAGAVFMMWALLPFILFVLIATPIAALTAALAFYQVNNRPISVLLESMFSYVGSGRLYLWKKETKKTKKEKMIAKTKQKEGYAPPSSQSNLASLSRQLEINALQKK